MIKSIWIDNFKSLVDFKLDLAKFSCLVGLNGSGKSTVLQAMDFLSQQMSGDLDQWLRDQQWDRKDINSKFSPKSNIDFEIEVEDRNFGVITWEGKFNRKELKCTYEVIRIEENIYLKVDDGICSIQKMSPHGSGLGVDSINDGNNRLDTEKFPIRFDYQGSIVSQLKASQLSEEVRALKDSIAEIKSLDLLSPVNLRTNTKAAGGEELGLGEQRLSGLVHALSLQNDTGPGFLLFEEIENGINPELMEYIVGSLVGSNNQVLVTSHSPIVLNYLEDDIAKQGVVYLYRTKEGITKAVKLFDIPSLSKKLEFMGPGEAYVDTELTKLYQEISNMMPVKLAAAS